MNDQKNRDISAAGLPAVSIIVPVYNAENSLSRCVDSILKQNYENFELLLIDDGSTDFSGPLCDEYAAADSRVRVIHKPNSGVSHSRNLAIEQARGEYLQFVDADDWLAPEATGLLALTAAAQSCDMVICDFYRVIDNRLAHKGDIQEEGLLSRREFAACMMERPADFYYGVLWNKLYKKELILRHGLRMDTQISWCEDFMFNLEYISRAENIYVLRTPLYYYVRTKHSLSSQGANLAKAIQMKLNVFEYYNRFYKEVFGEEDYEKSRLQVYRFLFDAASDGLVPPALLPGSVKLGDERIQIDPQVAEYNDTISDLYLKRKCLEACLRHAALRYDLHPAEAGLLHHLGLTDAVHTRRELAGYMDCSIARVTGILKSLKAKGYISWQEKTVRSRTETARTVTRTLEISLLSPALPVLESLENAQKHYLQICYEGLSQEEITTYENLSRRIGDNILRTLS